MTNDSRDNTPCDALVAALQLMSGVDPDYDDGIDADFILDTLYNHGFVVVPRQESRR